MKTISEIIESKYNRVDRYGDIIATWCEDGKQYTDTIRTDKADCKYYKAKVLAAYEQLIKTAPAANRDIIEKMVDKFIADNFTEESYRLSVVSALDAKSLMLNLKPYYTA